MSKDDPLFPHDAADVSALFKTRAHEWNLMPRTASENPYRQNRQVFEDPQAGMFYTLTQWTRLPSGLDILCSADVESRKKDRFLREAKARATAEKNCYDDAPVFNIETGKASYVFVSSDEYTSTNNGLVTTRGAAYSLLAVEKIHGQSIASVIADRNIDHGHRKDILDEWAQQAALYGAVMSNGDAANPENVIKMNVPSQKIQLAHMDFEYAGETETMGSVPVLFRRIQHFYKSATGNDVCLPRLSERFEKAKDDVTRSSLLSDEKKWDYETNIDKGLRFVKMLGK